MSIDVILNPRSRANRRDPDLGARMTTLLGTSGRVLAVPDLSALDQMTAGLAADPPQAIAIHGGDGTLHKTLSSLLTAFAGRPLPPVAILPGGTMNVVARSLGLTGRPDAILGALVTAVRASTPLLTRTKRCLKIAREYGFVFGNGLISNFLTEYYRAGHYDGSRALTILAKTFFSGLVDGAYSRRIVRRFEGRILVDGQPLPFESLTGVGCATVREVGLGFKLHDRADDHPDRFGFIAVHAGPVGLGLELPSVYFGRGMSPSRALSGTGTRLRVEPANGKSAYTIDGDLYEGDGPVEVDLGPAIQFFKWR